MAAVASGPLADQALDRLWDAVAERVQRNGMAVRGAIVLDGLDQAERFALAGLLGRPVDRVTRKGRPRYPRPSIAGEPGGRQSCGCRRSATRAAR